ALPGQPRAGRLVASTRPGEARRRLVRSPVSAPRRGPRLRRAHQPSRRPGPPRPAIGRPGARLDRRPRRPPPPRTRRAAAAARTSDPGWGVVTPWGSRALEKVTSSRPVQERRVFHLVADRRGQFGADPRCVELHTSEVGPWSAAEGWAFDKNLLGGLVGRDPEWKRRHGFPLDVQEVLGVRHGAGEGDDGSPTTNHTDLPRAAWRQVIVDVPEHLPAVLVLVSRGGAEGTPPAPQLRGFAVRQEGWVLNAERPAFTVATGWQERFPELAAEPALEVWRQAWKAWCQPRGVPAPESDACVLERHDYRLRVQVPKRLLDR